MSSEAIFSEYSGGLLSWSPWCANCDAVWSRTLLQKTQILVRKRQAEIKFLVAVSQNGIKGGLKKKKNHTPCTQVENNHPLTYICSTLKLMKDKASYAKLRWFSLGLLPGYLDQTRLMKCCVPLSCHFGWDGFGSADTVPWLGYFCLRVSFHY